MLAIDFLVLLASPSDSPSQLKLLSYHCLEKISDMHIFSCCSPPLVFVNHGIKIQWDKMSKWLKINKQLMVFTTARQNYFYVTVTV